jgi:hypothetical protein
MNIRVIPIDEYARMVREREPFWQANYGDGEWLCLMGHEGVNVNGERYNRTLAAALRATLLEPTGHWCATNPGRTYLEEVDAWVELHQPAVEWIEKETLPEANLHGQFGPFLAALRTRDVIMVGPRHLATLPTSVLWLFQHLPIRDNTAWLKAASTATRVRAAARPGCVVLFASGMASNLVIHRLTPWARSNEITLLDVGACLDPYVGVNSRKGYARERFQPMLAKNLEEAGWPC